MLYLIERSTTTKFIVECCHAQKDEQKSCVHLETEKPKNGDAFHNF
jgi:hypothetical protein